jgi:citrate lyase subunit beta/citryl-CoA lyase
MSPLADFPDTPQPRGAERRVDTSVGTTAGAMEPELQSVGGPGRGEAGRSGDDVRSDLHVMVEPAVGIDVAVTSKVEALYGESIRQSVAATFEALGINGARVTVDDRGAVPWVIAARSAVVEPTAADRLRRSRLYLPGNEPKFMLNAGLHRPDAVILDLEDSVHPAAKAAARVLVRYALRSVDFMGAERMVRINQLPLGLADLEEVVPEKPNLILVPKTERQEQVEGVAEGIRRIQEVHGIDPGEQPIWLMPILESALGLERAYEIATAAPTVVALTIGLEDYTADLGVAKTSTGEESLWARQRLVNAAHAAGVQAIDSVYGDVQDESGLLAWARTARAMGFTGMGCVHPRQIRVIHEGFAPSAGEIEKAERIVAAFRDAEARGESVVSLGSKMIDPPVVLRALRLLEHTRRIGRDGGDA